MSGAANYFAWQGQMVTPKLGRRVIEAGCGTGNFTGMLLAREAVLAVDSEPACVERLRERYRAHQNVETRVCDVAAPEFLELARFRADSCVCINVLEHVANDEEALRAMGSVVQPEGVVVLLTPAFPALYGPIDQRLGHHRRYTRRSLTQTAEAAGLRVESLRYMNWVGFFGWWANAHILKRQQQSEAQIAVFDRAVVPWLSWMEARVAPPFGQSLLAVLRKP